MMATLVQEVCSQYDVECVCVCVCVHVWAKLMSIVNELMQLL